MLRNGFVLAVSQGKKDGKTVKMSTKSVDLSSSFFQHFAGAFDLRQQGQGGWVTLLGAATGAGLVSRAGS